MTLCVGGIVLGGDGNFLGKPCVWSGAANSQEDNTQSSRELGRAVCDRTCFKGAKKGEVP